jgi:N-formylmethionyl-tRNA deformylase
MIKDILLLGNPQLYEISEPVKKDELDSMKAVVADLHDTIIEYKRVHGAGRAIAAPQIGIKKRMIYMYIDHAVVFINPTLVFPDNEKFEVLDDCMSFPNLMVKVMRYKKVIIKYRDLEWNECEMELTGDLAELLQHEYDHLDGILATMRAIDNQSFFLKER